MVDPQFIEENWSVTILNDITFDQLELKQGMNIKVRLEKSSKKFYEFLFKDYLLRFHKDIVIREFKMKYDINMEENWQFIEPYLFVKKISFPKGVIY